MKNLKKKGFTIVELVIVIAVIAILSAVLIPTFSNLVKKANESSDIQAVKQMNTILVSEDILNGGLTVNDAVKALNEAGLNGDDYVPLYKGRYFFFDLELKQIVYAEYKDGGYNVIFPEGTNTDGHALQSLSGKVAMKDYAMEGNGSSTPYSINISSSEELAQLGQDFKDLLSNNTPDRLDAKFDLNGEGDGSYKMTRINDTKITINLTQDIDLMGAGFNLNLENSEFVLNGNGHIISGVVNNSGFALSNNNEDRVLSQYGGAFIGVAINSKITFNNVTFKDCSFGNDEVKGSAVLVGQSSQNTTTTIENVKIENCNVSGLKGVAIYVGHFESTGGKIEFKETNTVNGCNLTAYATSDEDVDLIGTITGRVSGSSKTITGTAPTLNNISMVSGGLAINNAIDRSIVNASKNTNDSKVVKYEGNFSN